MLHDYACDWDTGAAQQHIHTHYVTVIVKSYFVQMSDKITDASLKHNERYVTYHQWWDAR